MEWVLNPLRRILIKILRVTEFTVSAGHIVAMVTCSPMSGHMYLIIVLNGGGIHPSKCSCWKSVGNCCQPP